MYPEAKIRTIRLLRGLKCNTCLYQSFVENQIVCKMSVKNPLPLEDGICVAYFNIGKIIKNALTN